MDPRAWGWGAGRWHDGTTLEASANVPVGSALPRLWRSDGFVQPQQAHGPCRKRPEWRVEFASCLPPWGSSLLGRGAPLCKPGARGLPR